LFQDEDFQVDETSREFQQMNPSTKVTPRSNLDHEKGLTAVEEEALDEVPNSSDDEEEEQNESSAPRAARGNDRISTADYKRRPKEKPKTSQQVQMRVSSSNASKFDRQREENRSFGSRAETWQAGERKRKNTGGVVGEKVITFEPAKSQRNSAPVPRRSQNSTSQTRRSASGNAFRKM
jgi:ribosome biogenesis protein ENP2